VLKFLRSDGPIASPSLRTVLALAFGGVTVAVVIALGLTAERIGAHKIKESTGGSLALLAHLAADRLDRDLASRLREIELLGRLDQLEDAAAPAKRRHAIGSLQATHPEYAWIGFTDRHGIVTQSTQRLLEGVDISGRDWFRGALSAPYVGDVHEAKLLAELLPNGGGEPLRFVDVAIPLRDRAGVTGVLGAHLNWNWARSVLGPLVGDSGAEILILDHAGAVLFGPSHLQGHTLLGIKPDSDDRHYALKTWPDGRRYLAGFSRTDGHGSFGGLGWTIIARQDATTALAPAYRLQQQIFSWGLALAVLLGLLTYGLAHGIAAPLRRLTAGVDDLRKNRATALPEAKGYAEVASLSASVSALLDGRQDAEEQLRQSQKMEAIGNLTGGMSHDFNNLLGVIIGNADLLTDHIRNNPEASALLNDVLEAALRGAELNRRLLAFARRQPLQPKELDVNGLVAGIMKLLSRTLGEQVEITVECAGNLWPVVVDPAQLEASIVNIATNARDAMPAGGQLTISTRNGHLDAAYAAEHPEVTPGDYVVIEVTDTGTGMPPEVISRAFEPFFTTKELGKGTGLGLSMVFGFLKQSGGHVKIYSEEGSGTTLRLYLPRMVKTSQALPTELVTSLVLATGSETVLVVEDNEKLRHMLLKQLRDLGYEVLEADNGQAALEALRKNPKVDLLLTDIVMPGMNGQELAQEAAKLYPGLRVLFTSGFPEAALGQSGTISEGDLLLSKPYRKQELAQKVRQALAA
jgi:signal transduction histidine kinase